MISPRLSSIRSSCTGLDDILSTVPQLLPAGAPPVTSRQGVPQPAKAVLVYLLKRNQPEQNRGRHLHGTPASAPHASAPYASAPYASAPYASAPYASAPYASAPYASAPYAQRHTLQRHTLQRHTLQRHTLQRHTLQRHTLQRHTLQRHRKRFLAHAICLLIAAFTSVPRLSISLK